MNQSVEKISRQLIQSAAGLFFLHARRIQSSLSANSRNLDQVVEDDHGGKQHQENKCRLIDPLFDVHADVAAHKALDQQEQDYSAVEDGNRQQVEDAEIQADGRSQAHERSPALAARRFA